jgi:hypothetical protein
MCFHKLYPSRFIENESLGLKCVIKAIKNGTTFANIKYKRFPCELGKVCSDDKNIFWFGRCFQTQKKKKKPLYALCFQSNPVGLRLK